MGEVETMTLASRTPRKVGLTRHGRRVPALLVALGLMASLFLPLASAQFPTTAGDDDITSLGTFRIFVHTAFRPLMVGFPPAFWDGTHLQSPVLFDPDTIIGRSAPHLDGSPTDVSGTAVGMAGTVISDADFSLVPPGFQGPPGTREIHTEVRRLHMTDVIQCGGPGLGLAVRAGTAAPGRPISPGEVESLDASGTPANDLPAESFFNVFVEVDIPTVGIFPGGTLYNADPLLVMNDMLSTIPPVVVYIHGNTNAVPVLFKSDDPAGNWQADDLFGWLVLAGHGTGLDCDDVPTFCDSISCVNERDGLMMPLPADGMISRRTVNVAEGGATATYEVELTAAPTADVTITPVPDGQVTVSPATLTFTPATWNVSQTVTVTAVDDDVAEEDHTGTVTHVASSSRAAYDGILISSVTATIVDDDTAGVTISPTSVNVEEGGVTAAYTVVLTSQPTQPVTITVSPDAQLSVSATALTFTAANWNVAQSVTVTAVDDNLDEGSHSGLVSHSVSSTDSMYSGISVANVAASIVDDDRAGFVIGPLAVALTVVISILVAIVIVVVVLYLRARRMVVTSVR